MASAITLGVRNKKNGQTRLTIEVDPDNPDRCALYANGRKVGESFLPDERHLRTAKNACRTAGRRFGDDAARAVYDTYRERVLEWARAAKRGRN